MIINTIILKRKSLLNLGYAKWIKVRSQLLVYLTHNMALPFLRLVRQPEIFPYSIQALSEMEAGTMGNDLYLFLKKRDLQLLPYYAKHDMKHILLQYDTTDVGEVSLQCFMLGNRHVSFPVAATVAYGFLTMPEYWSKFAAAFKKGRASEPIGDWKWFTVVKERTSALKQKISKS